jgi:hypothetical protein
VNFFSFAKSGGTVAKDARFWGKEDHAMQTGFFELTMIGALMLSSLVWIQPF